jgi:hypothetical protein
VALGMVLVVLDFRIDALDLLPDPLGYAAMTFGLVPLTSRHRGFLIAAVAAAAGVLASLPDVTDPTFAESWWAAITGVLQTLVVVPTCVAVAALLPAEAGLARAVWVGDLMVLGVSLLAEPVLGPLRGGAADDLLAPLVLVLVGFALLVVAGFVWLLVRAARSPLPQR